MHSARSVRKKRRTRRERTALTHEHCTAPHRQVGTCTHTIHAYMHTCIRAYMHAARNKRSAAEQNAARDARVHTNPHVYIVAMWISLDSQDEGSQEVCVPSSLRVRPYSSAASRSSQSWVQRDTLASYITQHKDFSVYAIQYTDGGSSGCRRSSAGTG